MRHGAVVAVLALAAGCDTLTFLGNPFSTRDDITPELRAACSVARSDQQIIDGLYAVDAHRYLGFDTGGNFTKAQAENYFLARCIPQHAGCQECTQAIIDQVYRNPPSFYLLGSFLGLSQQFLYLQDDVTPTLRTACTVFTGGGQHATGPVSAAFRDQQIASLLSTAYQSYDTRSKAEAESYLISLMCGSLPIDGCEECVRAVIDQVYDNPPPFLIF